jgi:hypothetical protein
MSQQNAPMCRLFVCELITGRTEQDRMEHKGKERNVTEQSRVDQNRTENTMTEQSRKEQNRTGENTIDQNKT